MLKICKWSCVVPGIWAAFNHTFWILSDNSIIVWNLLKKQKSVYSKIGLHMEDRNYNWQTFESEHPGGGVHESRVGSDGSAQRLHGRGHVDDDHIVLWRCLAHADVFPGIHRHMGECDELGADSDARKLHGKSNRSMWVTHKRLKIIQAFCKVDRNVYRESFFHCNRSIGRHDCLTKFLNPNSSSTKISNWNDGWVT